MVFPKLFSPITVRGLTLENRIVMSSMGTLMVGEDRKMTRQIVDFLTERAKNGVGLVYSQVSSVHEASAPPGFLAISNDEVAETHRMLTESIHAVGGTIGCQLWQGAVCVGTAARMLVPSDLPKGGYTIPGMSAEDIAEVIEAYGKAAARAVAVGYDIIEFHSGHSYLPHLFLNPAFNRRTDEYGGSFENRCRFGIECIKAIRANMPADMPLSMRVVAHDDDLPVKLTIEEIIEYCKLAGEAGVDMLNVSRGNVLGAGLKYEVPPVDLARGFNVDNAARIRLETGMLTIAVGRINRAEQAEAILAEDKADMVVMARAQLADAEFCKKAKEGRTDEITYCIGCDQGCMDPQMAPGAPLNGTHITCLRNPSVGKEKEYAFVPTQSPKTVLIAGGGMGGLEAAYRARMIGHRVILCEASEKLGGQFILAGEAPRKGEFKQAAFDNARRAERVGAEIRLNTEVTPALIEEIKPDVVLIAIGAEPIIIPLEGVGRANVYNSHDVLAHKVKPEGVVGVIGGGMVGLETAEFLAAQGNKVKVIEMQADVAVDMGMPRKICTLENMYREGIETIKNTNCKAVEDDGILAECEGEALKISCDSVVMAVGSKSRPSGELQAVCERLGIPAHVIGDAQQARRALNATADAARIVCSL